MKKLTAVLVCVSAVMLCSCQTDSNTGVVDKVLSDWGLRERPEGYVSGADRVFEKLGEVGQTELKRMNQEGREGTVKFEDDKGLRGKYYKEVKIYEDFYPSDAQASSRTNDNEWGFIGYIDYTYRIYQSERKSSRVEAAAEPTSIATDQEGRETYRYRFGTGGAWDGAKGERVRQ